MHNKLIQNLYSQIQKCTLCNTTISEKVMRKLESVNIKSDVFVIAEAMAPSQVRVSGINYFNIDGKLGNTGKFFEKFLNKFGYSVYPNKNCIYHTEIVHCFPGYETKSGRKIIRRPTKEEINNCITRKFIQQEIEIVKPKVILLMGKVSYETFYNEFLKIKLEMNLSKKIDAITETNKYDKYDGIPIIPIQHASGANPRFNQMLNNEELIELIKEILE